MAVLVMMVLITARPLHMMLTKDHTANILENLIISFKFSSEKLKAFHLRLFRSRRLSTGNGFVVAIRSLSLCSVLGILMTLNKASLLVS